MRNVWIGLLAVGAMGLASAPANATITFQTGNKQYTNVNIAADVNALSVTGAIGNTGISMTFQDMIGPDCTTQVLEHGQHGVAFVESAADSVPAATHTGFCSLTLMAESGTGWNAGDFSLDQLNSLTSPTGFVTFVGTDQFGNTTSDTLAIDQNGQNAYNFTTAGGELVTQIIISVAQTDLLQDIKQVSLSAQLIGAPEPLTLAFFGAGLAGLAGLAAAIRRREKAAKTA